MFAVDKRPLAVVVKGNPKYLDDPKIKPMADKFYAEIKQLLEAKGFRVEFDPGKEFTSPKKSAKVWIGHSRGIDRLQYAPAGVQTIALETAGHGKTYKNHDESGHDPLHYQLSEHDLERIAKLKPDFVSHAAH